MTTGFGELKPPQTETKRTSPLSFPSFPSVFGEKEASRIKELETQRATMQQVWNQKFTPQAWSNMNPVEQKLRQTPIVNKLISWFTPHSAGWDYGFTPQQAQQQMEDVEFEYKELARRQKVNTILPDIMNNMVAAALAGTPLKTPSEIIPSGLMDDFNEADKTYLVQFGERLAKSTPEQILSGELTGVLPSTEPANYLDIYMKNTSVSPSLILSTIAFSKNQEEIASALKAAYPASPSPEESGELVQEENYLLRTSREYFDLMKARAKELNIPLTGKETPTEIAKLVNAVIAKRNQGKTVILADAESGVMTNAVVHSDSSLWTADNKTFLGFQNPDTGAIVSDYEESSKALKARFPDLSDTQVDAILSLTLPSTDEEVAALKVTPAFDTFWKDYYEDRGWVIYGDPSSFNYGNHPAFRGSTEYNPNEALMEDMEHYSEAMQAYREQYGSGKLKQSAFAKGIAGILPTTSKLINPEKPKIKWYDPLWDIAAIAGTVSGTGAMTGALSRTASVGLNLLGSTSYTVAQTEQTIRNWDENTAWLNALNVAFIGAGAFGSGLSAKQAFNEVAAASFRRVWRQKLAGAGYVPDATTKDAFDAIENAYTAQFMDEATTSAKARTIRDNFFKKYKPGNMTTEGDFSVIEDLALSAGNLAEEATAAPNFVSKIGEEVIKKSTALATTSQVELYPGYAQMKANLPPTIRLSLHNNVTYLLTKGISPANAETIAFNSLSKTAKGKASIKAATRNALKVTPEDIGDRIAKFNVLKQQLSDINSRLQALQDSITLQESRVSKADMLSSEDVQDTLNSLYAEEKELVKDQAYLAQVYMKQANAMKGIEIAPQTYNPLSTEAEEASFKLQQLRDLADKRVQKAEIALQKGRGSPLTVQKAKEARAKLYPGYKEPVARAGVTEAPVAKQVVSEGKMNPYGSETGDVKAVIAGKKPIAFNSENYKGKLPENIVEEKFVYEHTTTKGKVVPAHVHGGLCGAERQPVERAPPPERGAVYRSIRNACHGS